MSLLQVMPATSGTPSVVPQPIKITICESTSIAGELLRAALSGTRKFYVAACVTDSRQASHVLHDSPDILLISSRLEDGPLAGFQVLRAARQTHPAARCVMLLEDWGPELVVDAFRSGAAGVFHRGDSFDHLCRCLSVVHEGQIWASTAALKYLISAIERVSPARVTNAKGDELLTRRELEVVSLVADGMSNRDISACLKLSEHTVKNHLFHIFEKLGISSRVELVLYIVNQRERMAA
jgi:DNA-binding NarL/FixJ family response regulator